MKNSNRIPAPAGFKTQYLRGDAAYWKTRNAALVEALRGAQLALRTVACRVENKEPDLGAYCHAEANKAYEPLRVIAARALGV